MSETSTDQDHTDILMRITLVCIAITAGISGITIMGWTVKWLIITRISVEYIPMAPSTALSFFILSVALLIYTRYNEHPLAKTLGKAGIILIISVCSIILVAFLIGSDFDIEQILYPNPEDFGSVPIGRMSPLTAITFVLAGSAMLLLFIPRKVGYHIKSNAAFLATIEFLIGFLIVIGYWYGSPLLYGGTVVPVALTTAIAFVFLSIGTITAIGRDYWPIRNFIGESVNARLMRTFLPVTVGMMLIQGWLSIVAFPLSGNHVLSMTTVTLLSALIIGFVITKISQVIGNDIDSANDARTQAEDALRKNEHRLIRAQDIAHMGDWEFDIEANELTWSDELYRIYGVDLATEITFENAIAGVHPDDRDYVNKILADWMEDGEGESFECRIMRPDGSIRYIYSPVEAAFDSNGNVIKLHGIVLDITELKETEGRFHTLYSAMNEGVAIHEMIYDEAGEPIDYRILDVNPVFESITGIKTEDVIGVRASELYGTGKAPYLDLYAKVAASGDPITFETTFEPMGKAFKVSVFSPGKDKFATLFADVSQRKQSEEEIVKLARFNESILTSIPVGIVTMDQAGKVTTANDIFLEIMGSPSLEETLKLGINIQSLEAAGISKAFKNTLMTGNSFEMNEMPYTSHWGKKIIVNLRGVPLKDMDGNITGVVFVVNDVTDMAKAEQTMQLNEMRLNALVGLNQMTRASFTDVASFVLEKVVQLTKSEYGFVGLMNDDESVFTIHSWSKIGLDICKIDDKPIDYPIENAGIWGDAVRQRKVIIVNDYSNPNTPKTGIPEGHMPLSCVMSIPIFEDKKIVAVATVANKETDYDDSDARQITLLMDGMWKFVQHKQAEEKLKKYAEELAISNEELKSLDTMKDEFLSNVSHELKTPLISIKGFSEVVLDGVYGPLNDKQNKAMSTVVRNCERLVRLIDSVLYLSMNKAGVDSYMFNFVSVSEIIGHAITDITPQANSKKLTIEQNIAPDMPLIKGDADKLTQILINLIENATKFTPNGGKIIVEAYEEGENIHVKITDTGIGVSADVISNLFERFYQVDASTTRHYGGTGIGLYISKLIVAVHKGKIWVKSEKGVGTTFHVLLPK